MSSAQVPSSRNLDPLPGKTEGIAGGLDLILHVAMGTGKLALAPVRAALLRRIQQGALELSVVALVVGTLAGFITLETVGSGLGLGNELGVRVLQTLVISQLAGFVCALLVASGPGIAATFELGLMRHQGELRTLRLIGIDPRDYLVLPCVLGFALALFVLGVLFQLAAVLGGFSLMALVSDVGMNQLFGSLVVSLSPPALAMSGLKDLLLGAIIGLIVCQQGLAEPFSPAQMPRIARRLLVRSLVALIVVHGSAAILIQ